jgi:Carbohydrate-binding module 48 (Isoamylase N-terminal domain)
MTDHDFEPLDPYVQWIATEARRSVPSDPAARRRLLDAIRAEPLPQRRPRVVAFLLRRRSFVMPPLAAAAMAAGLVALGFVSGYAIHRDGRLPAGQRTAVVAGHPQLPDSQTPRAVKFVLIAPQAQRVAVVGDFNGWDADANPMQTTRAADGRWTVFVPLRPGLHVYSFLVDGDHFLADPSAPVAPDDGYGHKSSVVVVGASTL